VGSGNGVYIFGPIIAFIVVGVLAAILRWTFDPGVAAKQAEIFGEPADYGLLSVAAVVDTQIEGRSIQQRLISAGIRATITSAPDGRVNVLVFEAELDAARRLVGGSPL
jgi:hypothetical protein